LAALVLLASVAGLAVPGPAGAQRPETIDLPEGFQGEGVATGRHGTFYAGSRADGRIAIGSLRDGTSDVFVEDPLVSAATGLEADLRHGLLWVAGAATGQAAAYDLDTGAGIEALTLTTAENTFVNDLVVTRDAVYFTDSLNPVIYRVPVSKRGEIGEPEAIALSGPASEFEVAAFNLNGIDATRDGRTLIVVNSFTGALYTVDAATGASEETDLGGASVPTGDGILLHGHTLFVLQNGSDGETPNQIAVVRLRHNLTEGTIVDTITSPLFETATTLARSGGTLLAVNAQFAPPPIDAEPEVVLLRRR
jgi:sugar lactone lactonase YvrE